MDQRRLSEHRCSPCLDASLEAAWDVQDLRTLNQTRVILEYNAGFTGAMAAMVEAPGTWEVCLQVASCTSLHPIQSLIRGLMEHALLLKQMQVIEQCAEMEDRLLWLMQSPASLGFAATSCLSVPLTADCTLETKSEGACAYAGLQCAGEGHGSLLRSALDAIYSRASRPDTVGLI